MGTGHDQQALRFPGVDLHPNGVDGNACDLGMDSMALVKSTAFSLAF